MDSLSTGISVNSSDITQHKLQLEILQFFKSSLSKNILLQNYYADLLGTKLS